ncbi:MAG: hypothetical protein IJQ31_16655 [Thermoguttaceae bacterium]|nr:hypothetical protein [Thermoguttaceae bacterium]
MSRSLQILNGLKILHVAGSSQKEPWLAKAVREVKGVSFDVREVCGKFDGLKALQTEMFDAALVSLQPTTAALDFITGCRTSGTVIPMLILGTKIESNQFTLCCERGGDGWISLEGSTVSDLLWQIALAVQNRRNADLQNRHLLLADQEFAECCEFLEQEKSFVQARSGEVAPSEELRTAYLELLKTFIPGTNAGTEAEIQAFLQTLMSRKTSSTEILAIHASALEEILAAPGRKSPSHLMNRANLLLTELLAMLLDEAGGPKQADSFAKSREFTAFPVFRPENS